MHLELGVEMEVMREVVGILDEVLRLGGRSSALNRDSALIGSIPELDSMAVVAILTSIEERFGVMVEDDEIDGAVFATLGTLTDFVQAKVGGA
jgi:acyl carrier protein